MKNARVFAPFGLSALLFILSYLSSLDIRSGSFPLLLLAIGVIMAFVGVGALFSDK